jgi:hypothetical protein
MRLPCPTCGAVHEWDSVVQHDYARKALAAAFALPPALQVHIARYLRLFASPHAPQRALTPDRYATLLQAVVADINKGAIEARGRTWSAPVARWAGAFEAVFAATADGRRKLPLRDHSYLYGVLVNMADQAEAKGERATEQQRQSRPLVAVEESFGADAPADDGVQLKPDAAEATAPAARAEVPEFVKEALSKLTMGKRMANARKDDAPQAEEHPLIGKLARVIKGKWKGRTGTVERVTATDVVKVDDRMEITETVALRIEFARNGTQVITFKKSELEL